MTVSFPCPKNMTSSSTLWSSKLVWSSWGVGENVIPLAAGCWAEESWNVLRNIMNDDEERSSSCSKSLSMVVEVEVGEDERGTAAAKEKAAEWTLKLWIVQCPDTSNSARHFGLWQWFKDWYWGNHGGGSWSPWCCEQHTESDRAVREQQQERKIMYMLRTWRVWWWR